MPNPKSVEQQTQAIKSRLKEFGPPIAKAKPDGFRYRHRLSGDYEMLRLVRFIFSDILQFEVNDQPFEKVNWWIPFEYEGKYQCVAAHEKFGFRVYVTADNEEEARTIGEKIEKQLDKALHASRPIVEHYAKDALKQGDIIVENIFGQLFGPYEFFRKMALKKKRAAGTSVQKTSAYNLYKQRREQEYFEQATYFSFFSMLEHLCVLFLAYRNIPERKDVASFSRLNWSDKFKCVFDIMDPEFGDIYTHLIGIARYRRNPAAHGYAHTVFDFYLKGARHKISASLNERDVSLRWNDQTGNFEAMESFLKLIKKHKTTRNIFAYIQTGLNISFAASSLPENDRVARMSLAVVREHIEYMIRLSDDMGNMDW